MRHYEQDSVADAVDREDQALPVRHYDQDGDADVVYREDGANHPLLGQHYDKDGDDDLFKRDYDIDPIIAINLALEENFCDFMNISSCMIDYKSPAQSGVRLSREVEHMNKKGLNKKKFKRKKFCNLLMVVSV